MMRLNNGFEIPLSDDLLAINALNQNQRSNALNAPETFPW